MSSDCLRVGHLNVYHIENKIYDVNVLFKSHQRFHLFGLSETRLKNHIPSKSQATLQVKAYLFLTIH